MNSYYIKVPTPHQKILRALLKAGLSGKQWSTCWLHLCVNTRVRLFVSQTLEPVVGKNPLLQDTWQMWVQFCHILPPTGFHWHLFVNQSESGGEQLNAWAVRRLLRLGSNPGPRVRYCLVCEPPHHNRWENTMLKSGCHVGFHNLIWSCFYWQQLCRVFNWRREVLQLLCLIF